MFANEKNIMNIYSEILEKKKINKKSFALLIDPDKQNKKQLESGYEEIYQKVKKSSNDT